MPLLNMPKDQIYANNTYEASRVTVADLYPELSLEEQAEVKDTLKRYVALVWRIYQRARRQKRKI